MLEERERAYKEGLIERFETRVPTGEKVEAVAICQVGAPPWVQVVPIALGTILVAVSLLAGALPIWVGAVGAALVLGGGAMTIVIRRRLLARTNRAVHVFSLPRLQKAAFEKPRVSLAIAELPSYDGGSVELAGERLWPNYGSGNERDALAAVLAPSI